MKFQTLQEILHREAFDVEATLTLENYAGTVAQTSFPENGKGRCQLLRVHGRCGTKFQHGWLVTIASGAEVLLGCCCAANHFQLAQFNADSSALAKAIELAELRERYTKHLADAQLRTRLRELQRHFSTLEHGVRGAHGILPAAVDRQLTALANSTRATATYRVEYLDENARGEEVRRLEERQTGPILGLRILLARTLSDPRTAIAEALRALEPTGAKLSARQLQSRLKSIDAVQGIPEMLMNIERPLAAFKTLENYILISLLARRPEQRVQIVRAALGLVGARSSDTEARRLLEDFKGRLSRSEGGRRVVFG